MAPASSLEIIEPDFQIRDAGPLSQQLNYYARTVLVSQAVCPHTHVVCIPEWLRQAGFVQVKRLRLIRLNLSGFGPTRIEAENSDFVDVYCDENAGDGTLWLVEAVARWVLYKCRDTKLWSDRVREDFLDRWKQELVQYQSKMDIYIFSAVKPRELR